MFDKLITQRHQVYAYMNNAIKLSQKSARTCTNCRHMTEFSKKSMQLSSKFLSICAKLTDSIFLTGGIICSSQKLTALHDAASWQILLRHKHFHNFDYFFGTVI